MTEIHVTIIALLCAHLIPLAVMELMILEYPFSEWKNGWVIRALSCTSGALLYCVLFLNTLKMLFGGNPVQKILEMAQGNCTYQSLMRLGESNIMCAVQAAVLGFLIISAVRVFYWDRVVLRWKGIQVALALIWIFPLLAGFRIGLQGSRQISIREVSRMISVEAAAELSDEAGKAPWFSHMVIRNDGILPNEISGISLAAEDDPSYRLVIRADALEPGESYTYMIPANFTFNIRKKGGTVICLLSRDGELLDSLEVPALKLDQSLRRTPDGWQVVELVEEEPEITVVTAAPTFSMPGGFYQNEVTLALEAEPGTIIYYTLDGSDPTVQSQRYTRPISITNRTAEPNVYRAIPNVRRDYLNHTLDTKNADKATVVRAIAVDADGVCSDIVTETFFVDLDKYSKGFTLSLVSDPDGLFNSQTGIYVTGEAYDAWYAEAYMEGETPSPSTMPLENYLQRGEAWERPANIELYQGGQLVSSQAVGIRMQGRGSCYNNTKKRFSIYSRSRYSGSTWFDIPLFSGRKTHSMYLRTGDHFGVCQQIMTGRAVTGIESLPMKVDVFLDGEHWYSVFLFEKFSEKNYAERFGLAEDNLVMVKNGKVVPEAELGPNPYSGIYSFLKTHDLSNKLDYEQFGTLIDIQSYTEMFIANFYFANMDVLEDDNSCAWHTIIPENHEQGDTRWRWALYDVDLLWSGLDPSFTEVTAPYEINTFTMRSVYKDVAMMKWPIFSKLYANVNYRRLFVNTFMDLRNSVFTVENTMRVLDRLGFDNEEIRTFFRMRPETSVQYVAEALRLYGSVESVTLRSDAPAKIRLNTLDLELSGEDAWQGEYFTDYSIAVSTEEPGFSHWEIIRDGRTEILEDAAAEIMITQGGVQIHAVFQ